MAVCVTNLFFKIESTLEESINILQGLILNCALHKHERYLHSSALLIKPGKVTAYLILNPMCLCKTMAVKIAFSTTNTFTKCLLKQVTRS